jgi:hypothetical protein
VSPEEHYAEAERLLGLALKPIISGTPIGFNAHADAAALALVHATLALYRPPVNVVMQGFTPDDEQADRD